MKHSFARVIPAAACAALFCAGSASAQVPDVQNPRAVAGIPVNNVEADVKPYTLPELLQLSSGQPVKDADTWMGKRRPEIVKIYETEVYGRIPATAPKVTWSVVSEDRNALGSAAVMKQIVGRMGGPEGPPINVTLYTPAGSTKPVPVLVAFSFGAPPGGARGAGPAPAQPTEADLAALNRALRAAAEKQDPSVAEIFAKNPDYQVFNAPAAAPIRGSPIPRLLENGIGYATLSKGDIETDIEGSARNPNVNIARKLGLAPGQTAPAADEWGAIAAWAWGLSRLVDYFETDKDVDATRVAITGGSRLGKTVLWAGVNDPRIALVIAVSGGEGGAALARRNYGETIAHLVEPTRYPYQFAANYQKYAAHPENAPFDTHFLVAAMAPRPLLLHTANADQWSDPKGEYLAAIAATPAYELAGKKGVNRTPDQEPVTGEIYGEDLAFYLNNGGHASQNWDIMVPFMVKHFHPEPVKPASTPPTP